MNSEIRVLYPRPTKASEHIFFKNHVRDTNSHNILNNSEIVLEDLSKLRGNSQNPQEKDDSFKSQSEPHIVDDLHESWSEFDEIFSL